jgi:hypothetical protein
VCYCIIVMWYMLKQIQSLDLLINSCIKENPLCDVISPVCPETYGKQGYVSFQIETAGSLLVIVLGWHLDNWGRGAVSRSWSYGSWIYNYLCNQSLSPLTLSSKPFHGEMYSIQHYVIKFVIYLRQVGGFLRYSGFLHQ